MVKRRPEDAGIDMQVKREDFDADEGAADRSEDEGGEGEVEAPKASVQAAPPAERRIIKARRPGQHNSDAAAAQPVVNNPFAGLKFGLTAAPAGVPPATASASTGTTAAPATAGKSLFSFPPVADGKVGLFSGFSAPAAKPAAPEPVKLPSGALKPASIDFPAKLAATSSADSGGSKAQASSAEEEKYYKTLAGLNKAFASWVSSQMASNPDQAWTTGVNDYIAHCVALGQPPSASNTAPALSSWPEKPLSIPSAAPPQPSSLFTQPSTSIFGHPLPTPSSIFSQPKPVSAAAPSAGDDEDGDGEGGEDIPEEPTIAVARAKNEEEDTVVEADPAKAMYFAAAEKEWKAKGKGRLSVLKDKASGKHRLVLHGETTGKVMLNAPVNSSLLPSLKQDKKAVTLSLISYGTKLEPENGGKPLAYRLVFASEGIAQAMHAGLVKAMQA